MFINFWWEKKKMKMKTKWIRPLSRGLWPKQNHLHVIFISFETTNACWFPWIRYNLYLIGKSVLHILVHFHSVNYFSVITNFFHRNFIIIYGRWNAICIMLSAWIGWCRWTKERESKVKEKEWNNRRRWTEGDKQRERKKILMFVHMKRIWPACTHFARIQGYKM